jgi:hypothetical protein
MVSSSLDSRAIFDPKSLNRRSTSRRRWSTLAREREVFFGLVIEGMLRERPPIDRLRRRTASGTITPALLLRGGVNRRLRTNGTISPYLLFEVTMGLKSQSVAVCPFGML